MKRKIGKGLMIAGALLVWGAAGDSDTGVLDFDGVLLKVAISIALILLGYILHKNKGSRAKAQEHLFNNEVFVSRQVMTPAYKKILTQRKEFVNHETY
ncbi:MAG: hypothetical protein IJ370_04135 [Oscillospiraceae bacterium]|nr:hypothetical protein [Oscillospiraceae bacterium]